jgi:hypothetical protein
MIMKKTMPSKSRKTARGRNMQGLEVHEEALKVLRIVGDQEAFYFYEDIGKPTGEVAKSLLDFLDKMTSVKTESLMFHLQRKDFQNWVEKILGDSKLARELAGISSSNTDDVRTKIHETVENRLRELRDTSAVIATEESALVLLPSS